MTETRRRALVFVLAMGLVSLLADVTYEGARSVTGPFLGRLGAEAALVGLVAGAGELLGYGLRVVSGYLAGGRAGLWPVTISGYVVNLLAVPALALVGKWEAAAALILMERVGKGVRTPARDAMLSYASSEVGRGWAFGVHEALDQVGAVSGPLMVAVILARGGGYREAFAWLAVPAALALAVLAAARVLFPQPRKMELPAGPGRDRLGRRFAAYTLFSSLFMLGFVNFQLVSFHLDRKGILARSEIPLAFALAMGVDALAALAAGRAYDRLGPFALAGLPFVTAVLPFFLFSRSRGLVWAGAVLWGAVMGVQESTLRASVADLTPARVRPQAYGLFQAALGVAWFAGSSALGAVYGWRPELLPLVVIVAEVLSLLPLASVVRGERDAGTG